VKVLLAAKDFRLIKHPPYSPDLARADFFLFPTIKRQLAGKPLTQDTFKSMYEGVAWTFAKENFATAFRRLYECALAADASRNLKKKTFTNLIPFFY
jgi:hypothetical protein